MSGATSTLRAVGNGRWTDAIGDERLWQRIQPLAETLFEDEASLDDAVEGDRAVEVREFQAGAVRCRACAIPLPATARSDGAVVVAIERAPARLPTVAELRRWYDLTRREAEVALLLAERRTNREVAGDLCISPHTARRHTERVLQKLGVRRRTEVERVLRGL
ncbi:MAG: response regulator transcription factor [Gemmatimonadota bacterium]